MFLKNLGKSLKIVHIGLKDKKLSKENAKNIVCDFLKRRLVYFSLSMKKEA